MASFRLPKANHEGATSGDQNCPGDKSQQTDRSVIPERLYVMVEIGAEAFEIVLQDEDSKKLGIMKLHEHVPGQRNRAEHHETGHPKGLFDDGNITLGNCEDND